MEGLNAGYAALLLEQYLENPSAVPEEWRTLFESSPEEFIAAQPGLARLLERLQPTNGGNGRPVAWPPPAPPPGAGRRHGRSRARDRLPDAARHRLPHARAPRGAPRPARVGADGRPDA